MSAEMKWAGCPLDFGLFLGSSFNQVYGKSETSLPSRSALSLCES